MPQRAGWQRRWWRAGVSGVATLLLIVAACWREREEGERQEEASESPAQDQHERAQTQRPLAPVDWKQVDAALGKSGALQPDGAYKVGMPRSDLHITAAGVAVKGFVDHRGLVARTEDGLGNYVLYTYNDARQLIRQTDSLGHTESFTNCACEMELTHRNPMTDDEF